MRSLHRRLAPQDTSFQLDFQLELQEAFFMALLDWSQCPAVESIHSKVSGAWVFKDTRLPVATIFEDLEAASPIEEIMEQFRVSREQINAVLEFTAQSLRLPPVEPAGQTDSRPL
jgi:uncharacterized protein (DUF433 family)